MKKTNKLLLDDNVEIVVAHYNENLERLEPYAKNAIVYHKGREDFPKINCKKWISLPNIGRESHTYLYHIANNYENLPKYTLFFQGGIKDHIETGYVYSSIENYLNEVKKYGFSCAKLFFLVRKDPQINYTGKFDEMLKSGSLKKSSYTFAGFYRKLLGKDQGYLIPCFRAANFAVRDNLIKARSLSFYRKALKLLTEHPNPEEGHYYERLRYSIFNTKYNLHTLRKLFIFYFGGFKKKLGKIFVDLNGLKEYFDKA